MNSQRQMCPSETEGRDRDRPPEQCFSGPQKLEEAGKFFFWNLSKQNGHTKNFILDVQPSEL